MQSILRKRFEGKTVIAIAHRLDTIMDFDRIAVLDNGRLVECGEPHALLAKQSFFKQLYSRYTLKEEE